jgi:DNA polymerase
MPILIRDYETRSALDITEVGAWRYTTDPSTDVWCCAYCVDDGPIKLWKPGDPDPDEFIEAARNSEWTAEAFQDGFERLVEAHIMGPRYGWPLIPIERHRCLQAAALAQALPAKLEDVADLLELEHRKDKAGSKLMLQMAKPRRPRKGEDPAGLYWHDDPDRLARLHAYGRQDAAVEQESGRRIPSLSPAEQALWELDARINDRGMMIDGELLAAAIRIAEAAQAEIVAELQAITAGKITTVHQTERLIAWLAAHECTVTDCQRGTLKATLRRKGLATEVRRVIELRLAGAHAAANKLITMRDWRGPDGRVRGWARYHGASTGRWTSFGIQLQNLKKPVVEDMSAAIAAVATGEIEKVRAIGSPMAIVGDVTRGLIVAAPGHRFIAGDFSGVESRATAWVSDQQSKLAQWARFDASGNPEDEPYFVLGKKLGFNGPQARELGKVADLAFGYMGAKGAWQKLAPADDASTDEQIKARQQAWRRAHPETVRFWRMLESAALYAMRNPGQAFGAKRVTFTYDGKSFLRMRLPSGRDLTYPFPRVIMNNFGNPAIVFMDNVQGQWAPCRYGQGAWPGLWIENAVQAIARDLLAAALMRLEAAGYPVVLHVHDEIVVESPDGFGSIEEFKQLVTALPSWAEGLPVAAKIRYGPRFAKTEELKTSATPGDVTRITPDDTTSGAPWNDHVDDLYLDAAAEPTNETGAGADSSTGLQWSTPVLTEAPPRSAEFETILASLSEGDRAIVRPAAAGNGYDQDADQQRAANKHDKQGQHSQQQEHFGRRHSPDGYPHGERDTGHQIAFFVYLRADGQPYLSVKKTSTKQFPQFHVENGRWVKGPPQGPKIPYRLPELVRAPLNAWILIAAGEKDAETAAALGFVATTNPGGERKGAWAPELNAWFHGRRVAIMEDHDATGEAHVIEVAEALRGVASDIRIVTFRDLPIHGDLTDWRQADPGRSFKELLAKIEATAPYYRKPQPSPIRRWDGEPIPELLYAVPDRFPLENVGLFSGEGGQGKSSLIQQLCVAHTIGRGWLGCMPAQRPAIYIECEDSERVLRWRLTAIAAHYSVTLTEIANAGFQMFPLTDEESAILALAPNKTGIVKPTPLYDWLYELAGDIKPVMIGIASSANVFAGNENVRTEVQQFIRLLRRIACVANGSVLLVTQPSLTGIDHKSASHEGLAGTTQWHNAVRARAVMATVKVEDGIDTGLRQIKFHKNQYGPASAGCYVRYEGGLFLPVEGMSADAAQRAAKAEEVFVTLLRKFTAQKQMVSPHPSSTYAPARFAEHPEAQSISKKEFARAMQRLLDSKTIEIRTWGKPSKPIRFLAIVGEG